MKIEQYTYKYNIKGLSNLFITRDNLLDSISYNEHIINGYQPMCYAKIYTGHKDVIIRAFSCSALSKEWKIGGNVITLKNLNKSDLSNITLTVEIIWTKETIDTF